MLNSIHCCKNASFYFCCNNCQFLWNNFVKESYRVNITYFQVTGTRPFGRVIIAMAADYATNVNFGFEQFATAAGIYAGTNPLWPWITFQ